MVSWSYGFQAKERCIRNRLLLKIYNGRLGLARSQTAFLAGNIFVAAVLKHYGEERYKMNIN